MVEYLQRGWHRDSTNPKQRRSRGKTVQGFDIENGHSEKHGFEIHNTAIEGERAWDLLCLSGVPIQDQSKLHNVTILWPERTTMFTVAAVTSQVSSPQPVRERLAPQVTHTPTLP